MVRRTEKEPLWNSLLEEHHYLGYEQPVEEHLNCLVLGKGGQWPVCLGPRPRVIWAVATATLAGAPKHVVVMSASSPTTRDFYSCHESRCNTWRRISWAAWRC